MPPSQAGKKRPETQYEQKTTHVAFSPFPSFAASPPPPLTSSFHPSSVPLSSLLASWPYCQVVLWACAKKCISHLEKLSAKTLAAKVLSLSLFKAPTPVSVSF